MKQIEDIIESLDTPQRIKDFAIVHRNGVKKMMDKYGLMIEYAHKTSNMDELNIEMIRRDYLLFRYCRRYFK